MNKEALQRYVKGPLEFLKQACFAESQLIEDIWVKECGYNQWNRRNEKTGWKPFDQSRGFGGHEYHCLLRTEVDIPKLWNDRSVRLRVHTGADDIWNNDNPQFLLFLNDELSSGLDVQHREAELPDTPTVSIVLYSYVNTNKPNVFLTISLYAVNTELESLVYDFCLAYETALTVEEFSEAYLILSEACLDTLRAIDLTSLEALQNQQMLSHARKKMMLHLSRFGDSGRMNLALTGHSHIDMAWLWTLEQTREKSLRSYATVLSLMDRYPHYIFSSSQMQLLAFIKQDFPSLFARIKERVLEGRWEVEGAMWVESDAILTSGESLTRQIFWGKRWVKEEFGKDQKVLWLPDCFGFPATLPQIMAGTNLSYFVTTKLGWNETNRMPHDLFRWEGLDGSEVLAYFVSSSDYEPIGAYPKKPGNETTYNGVFTPSQLLGTWQRFSDREMLPTLLYLYGYGDGGGGPTKEMLEREERLVGGYPGLPGVTTSTVRSFLESIDVPNDSLATWFGELYLEYHRGTYTTMAEVKRLNRSCEQSAMQAEFFSSLLWLLGQDAYPHAAFEQTWKQLLLNQFHDILPGSSIKEVYDLALQQQENSLQTFTKYSRHAMEHIASLIAQTPADVVVFNTLGHNQSGLCKVSGCNATTVQDVQGIMLPSFHDGNDLYFVCTDVPSKGWKRLVLGTACEQVPSAFSWQERSLETPYYLVRFASDGTLSRLYDKEGKCEVLAPGGKGNIVTLSVDYPKEYDAWNIGKQGKDMRYCLDSETEYMVVANNALFFTIQWSQSWGKSLFVCQTTFYAHSKRIDFTLSCDFQEDQLMLRSEFQVDIRSPKASYDIAYGVCERTTHTNTSWDEAQFEVPAHKWVDLSDESYGVALMSKQNYGYAAKRNTLSLSLLRAPSHPNGTADRGEHHFTYALYPHEGRYQEAKVIEEGYALHQPLLAVKTEQHNGILSSEASLVSCPDTGIVLETVKKCEDRDSLLIRVLQLNGKRVKSHLHSLFPVLEAYQCNLLEERLSQLACNDKGVALSLRPHEIQTIELVLKH